MLALNKIDLVDQRLWDSEEGLSNVFKSVEVRKRMHLVHQETGLPINQIFPVKSYDSEMDRDLDVEKLALLCLREVIEANVEVDVSEDEDEQPLKNNNRNTTSDVDEDFEYN
jgi:hypothetical protein